MPEIRIAEGPHAGDTYPLDRQKSVMGGIPNVTSFLIPSR